MNDQESSPLPPPFSYKFYYSGSGKELAFIMYKNVFLTILTLGIYTAWGRTNTRRYIWGHTGFLGDRSGYTGTGKELFVGMVKVLGIYLLAYFGISFLAQFVHPMLALISLPIYGYLIPEMIYGGLRYRLSRTTWRGVQFGMDKNPMLSREFLILVAKYVALTILTLGICYPLLLHEMRKFLTSKMRFGNSYLSYTGTRVDLYRIYLKALFFVPMTFGLYMYWFKVEQINYRLQHTRFQNAHFRTSLTGMELLGFVMGSYILSVCTLGLALPWVINMAHKLIVNSIDLYGYLDLHLIENTSAEASGAAGDVGAEEYDIDIAI